MASIEKRGENSYRITVSAGFDGSGVRIKKRTTITLDETLTEKQKEKEVQKQAALFEAKVLGGETIDSAITLESFSEIWLKDYAEANLQPNTVKLYKGEIDNRILPALGHKRLDKIKPLTLMSFYNNLTEEGLRLDGKEGHLSDRTIKLQHQILSSMFSWAVRWQLINSNPCANVRPPKLNIAAIKPTVKHFDEKQASILIGVMEKEPLKYRAAIYLALFGGMRRGEILALTWDDVNFEEMTVDVCKSRQIVIGDIDSVKSTKNTSSNRKIALPVGVINVLQQLKAEQDVKKEKMGELWYDCNAILTTFDGHPMGAAVPYHALKKVITGHNKSITENKDLTPKEKSEQMLPMITFHALRHTSATLMIHAGVNVRAVSSRLGHAETSTTMNIYAHALSSADQQAADLLGNIIKIPGQMTLKLVK